MTPSSQKCDGSDVCSVCDGPTSGCRYRRYEIRSGDTDSSCKYFMSHCKAKQWGGGNTSSAIFRCWWLLSPHINHWSTAFKSEAEWCRDGVIFNFSLPISYLASHCRRTLEHSSKFIKVTNMTGLSKPAKRPSGLDSGSMDDKTSVHRESGICSIGISNNNLYCLLTFILTSSIDNQFPSVQGWKN